MESLNEEDAISLYLYGISTPSLTKRPNIDQCAESGSSEIYQILEVGGAEDKQYVCMSCRRERLKAIWMRGCRAD
jgi:hypothetical protein